MTLSLRCSSWTWDFLKFNPWQEWSDQNFPVLLCNICQPKKCAAFLKLPYLPWETLLYLAYLLIPSTLTDFQFKKEKLKKKPLFLCVMFLLVRIYIALYFHHSDMTSTFFFFLKYHITTIHFSALSVQLEHWLYANIYTWTYAFPQWLSGKETWNLAKKWNRFHTQETAFTWNFLIDKHQATGQE